MSGKKPKGSKETGDKLRAYLEPRIRVAGYTFERLTAEMNMAKSAATGWFKTGQIGTSTVYAISAKVSTVIPADVFAIRGYGESETPPSEPAGLRAGVDESLLARLTALATPRTAEILVRIAQANSEGRLTDNDLDLLAKIASRFEKA